MRLIVHVMNLPRSRTLWAVRVDGSSDLVFRAFDKALEVGRARGQELADQARVPVTIRVWQRAETVDEVVHPARGPRA